jgi:hypothetical protein
MSSVVFWLLAIIGTASIRNGQPEIGIGLILVGGLVAGALSFRAQKHQSQISLRHNRTEQQRDEWREQSFYLITIASTALLVALAAYGAIRFQLDEQTAYVTFIPAATLPMILVRWYAFGSGIAPIIAALTCIGGALLFSVCLLVRGLDYQLWSDVAKGLIIAGMAAILVEAAVSPEIRKSIPLWKTGILVAALSGLFVFSIVTDSPASLFDTLLLKACLLTVIVLSSMYCASMAPIRETTEAADRD